MANRLLLLTLLPILSCGGGPPQFDGEAAYRHLVAQCELGPRNPGSEGHERTIEYLTTHLERCAHTVSCQDFNFTDEKLDSTFKLTNILASFYPKEPGRILLCAHWDTRPKADREEEPAKRERPILGANDGASGVAVLLELASILRLRKPNYGVDIALFDGEDYGEEGHLDYYLLGSTHFAQNLGRTKYIYGILLDMVGDKDLAIKIEGHSLHYAPLLVQLIWSKARELGLEEFCAGLGPTVLDDHVPLNFAGIPTVDLIDFDYPYWHTLEDTPDKCSSASLKAIGDLLVALIYSSSHKVP